jgi:tetratricopeptide (TPR) repeat protein
MLRSALALTFVLAVPPPQVGRSAADAIQIEALIRQAAVLRDEARYNEAEAPLRRALVVAGENCRQCDVEICSVWNELGVLYKNMGRFDEAGQVYARALAIARNRPGARDDAVIATLYHNLGGLEHARGRYAAGEPLARRGLAIRERLLGPNHPDVAADLAALAPILDGLLKRQEAAEMLLRAIGILERAYGPDHYDIAVALNNLAALRYAEGNREESFRLYERSLAMKEKLLGPEHPDVATTLNNMAVLRKSEGDREEAGRLYGRALAIFEKSLGPDHPKTVTCRANYELQKTNKFAGR